MPHTPPCNPWHPFSGVQAAQVPIFSLSLSLSSFRTATLPMYLVGAGLCLCLYLPRPRRTLSHTQTHIHMQQESLNEAAKLFDQKMHVDCAHAIKSKCGVWSGVGLVLGHVIGRGGKDIERENMNRYHGSIYRWQIAKGNGMHHASQSKKSWGLSCNIDIRGENKIKNLGRHFLRNGSSRKAAWMDVSSLPKRHGERYRERQRAHHIFSFDSSLQVPPR